MNMDLWIYDIFVYIYALSLLFYFSDFVSENRKAKQLGTGLLVFVWLISGAFLIFRLLTELSMPVFHFTTFDVLQLFSWILITASFIIGRYYKIDLIVFFVNVIGFSIFALNIYSSPKEGRSLELWQATRELLYVHISLVISAYAVLTIGALLSMMYLIVHYSLKRKKWTKWLRRFPSLEVMDRSIERIVIIGVPLLIMSLAIATISLVVEGRAYLLLDIQIVTSLVALGIYGYFIYQRSVNQRSGQMIAKLYLLAYAFQLINMFSTELSAFH